jgi:hypothetical protein
METPNPIDMSCWGLLKTFMETIKPNLHVAFVYVTNFHGNHWDVTKCRRKQESLATKKLISQKDPNLGGTRVMDLCI